MWCVCVRARARVKINKLSLVALVEGFHYYRIEDPDVDPSKKAAAFLEAHCTLLMMILTLMIPQLLGLVSNLRECCYKAKHNNPYPSWTASFWIFVATLFESTGLSLFVLVVAPRIQSVLCLAYMNGIFALPSLYRAYYAKTVTVNGTQAEQTPLLGSVGAQPQRRAAANKAGNATHWQKLALWFAALLQVAGLVILPFFYKMTGAHDMIPVLGAASLAMISFAWLPAIQDRMEESCRAGQDGGGSSPHAVLLLARMQRPPERPRQRWQGISHAACQRGQAGNREETGHAKLRP